MKIVLILLLSMATLVSEARMYQWVEPEVETTQLSGTPPTWYRSSNGGPRIFVFENGRLIDDTAIEVSDEVRQRMRQQAFILGEEDRQKAKEKIAKVNKLKQKFQKNNSEREESATDDSDESDLSELLTDSFFTKDKEEDQGRDSENLKNVEDLKKIIADWEASKNEDAKKALE